LYSVHIFVKISWVHFIRRRQRIRVLWPMHARFIKTSWDSRSVRHSKCTVLPFCRRRTSRTAQPTRHSQSGLGAIESNSTIIILEKTLCTCAKMTNDSTTEFVFSNLKKSISERRGGSSTGKHIVGVVFSRLVYQRRHTVIRRPGADTSFPCDQLQRGSHSSAVDVHV